MSGFWWKSKVPVSSHIKQPGITDQLRCSSEKGGKCFFFTFATAIGMLSWSSSSSPFSGRWWWWWDCMVLLSWTIVKRANNEMRRPQNLCSTILINVGRWRAFHQAKQSSKVGGRPCKRLASKQLTFPFENRVRWLSVRKWNKLFTWNNIVNR